MTLPLTPLMVLAVSVGKPVTVDPGDHGRRFIPITGGTVTGGLTGKVLNGGGDWQTLLPNGNLEIRAHYIIDIDGHGTMEVHSDGVRAGPPEVLAALGRGENVDPSEYYFRTAMRFHTVAPGLERLNAVLAVATGRREGQGVLLNVLEIG